MVRCLGIRPGDVAHPDEGANDEDAHLDCPRAVQNGSGHDRAMFCEGDRDVAPAPAPDV